MRLARALSFRSFFRNPPAAFAAVLMAIAAAYVYGPALRGDWMWDDREEISQNPLLRDPLALGRIWLHPPGPDYYPLKTSVQWAQWHLWGDRTLGYHLTNMLLHVLSGVLVAGVLRRLGVRYAGLGGLLFVVYPLNVESVAWMAELKNALSLPLLLGAMGTFLDYDQAEGVARKGLYAQSLGWYLLSLLAKTSGVMFPAVILLHAWWRRGRLGRSDLLLSAPFFLLSLILGLVTVWFQQTYSIQAEAFLPSGIAWRLDCAGLSAAFYLMKSLVPVGLLPIYPPWAVNPSLGIQFLPWLAAAAVAAALGRSRAGWARSILFALAFFLVNVAPVTGLIPISHLRFTWAMDHLAYVPLIGVVGLAAAGLGLCPRPAAALGLGGLIVLLLATEARIYARNFRGEKALWEYTLERNPGAWLADNNLGSFLLAEGRTGPALDRLQAALRLKPDDAEADNNLGNAYWQAGDYAAAIAAYRRAVALQPKAAAFHNNLGLAWAAVGRRPEAIQQLEEAVRLKPTYGEACNNLGALLAASGRLPEALARYRQALAADPGNAEAHSNLGAALADTGDWAGAVAEYRRALALNPNLANARHNLEQAGPKRDRRQGSDAPPPPAGPAAGSPRPAGR